MTDKLCPFCGEVHRKVHWNKVIGYDAKEGSPILGQLNIGVDLTVHNPGGATVYVPIDLYNTRPIEDAQAAEIAKLELDLLQAGRLEHELNAIITDKDAEIERLQAQRKENCKWMIDDSEYGVWETGCGEAVVFDEETPKANGYKYCHYCGKLIEFEREAANE